MGNFFSNTSDNTNKNCSRRTLSSANEWYQNPTQVPIRNSTSSDIYPKFSYLKEDREIRENQEVVVKKREDHDDELKSTSDQQKRKKESSEGTITHYNRSQRILLVGEGDFSFSTCLANAFGSATNMVATSLDTEEMLLEKYSSSKENIRQLRKLGCLVIHDVGVHDMLYDSDLMGIKFDRIVFNFPHAGHLTHFPPLYETDGFLIEMHKKLLSGFFKSASKMLNKAGEIHVSHRNDYPYNKWEIKKLANNAGLQFIGKVKFQKSDYPGYNNKRGGDVESDKEFFLGESPLTFKFSTK
ncbi:hypothetical protein MKW94_014964 [Papaver nudicaule]|uniref:25S rRNA (uridine-N(3))-methyltransferase BMT5-like domain-containing protein n=1 Tax=Papaver nudicaule TaxID=74823 RepID=A0AA41VX95_PAPNU|nr:hypothetical protein [Papaver nudicaule]